LSGRPESGERPKRPSTRVHQLDGDSAIFCTRGLRGSAYE